QRQLKEARRELSRLRALQAFGPARGTPTEGGDGPRPSVRAEDADRTGARLALVFGLVIAAMTSLVAGRALSGRPRYEAWRYGPYQAAPCSHWADEVRATEAMAPAAPRLAQAVVRSGRVTATSGAAPVPLGASCDVRVAPTADPGLNCRVEVQCGGVLI